MPSYHNEKSSASRKTMPWGIAYRLDIDDEPGIQNRIEAFRQFAIEHPERMKQPGITRGK